MNAEKSKLVRLWIDMPGSDFLEYPLGGQCFAGIVVVSRSNRSIAYG